jgi:hypothetical protein
MANIKRFKNFFSNVNEKNQIESYIESSYDYEWVDISTAWVYREFDRSNPKEDRADSKKVISELSTKLQDGFKEPLIMQYSHKYKTAYLIEGNHRLLVAKQLGFKYVPIRVTIDGYQKKDAEKVVGFYASKYDKVDPKVPSEIGIPNCFDKNYKPVQSEDEVYEEEKEIDFTNLPDAKKYTEDNYIKKDIIEFKPLKNSWDADFIFSSDDLEILESVIENKNFIYDDYRSYLFEALRYDDSYFTDEMKKRINLPYEEGEDYEGYSDIYDMYFHEEFYETEEYKLYEKEIARVLWEKFRKDALTTINTGTFESPFGGNVDWLNPSMREQVDINFETYEKTKNGKYYFSYDGVKFIDEEIKDYEFDGDESTFEEILKKNYDYQTNVDMDFNEVEDYTVDIKELNIENIFKTK